MDVFFVTEEDYEYCSHQGIFKTLGGAAKCCEDYWSEWHQGSKKKMPAWKEVNGVCYLEASRGGTHRMAIYKMRLED